MALAKTGTWVYRNGKLVLKHLAEPRYSGRVRGVISDTMEALIHPCTGNLMDSKSEFRKITKAKGGVEVGNEKLVDRRSSPELDSQSRRRDISIAMEQLGI
jgi:hypothetical protein